jgi:hypothetical protein
MKKFDLKKAILENKATFFSSLTEGYVEEAKNVSKEDKIAVIKEWVWYTCDEGQAKEDINKYNKMIDMYFADKNDVTKQDFKNIWNKVIEKYGVGDTGADSEAFPETWRDVQTGNLVNPDQVYEGEAAYEYEKGKEAGEEIEKKKMKESTNSTKGKTFFVTKGDESMGIKPGKYTIVKSYIEDDENVYDIKDEKGKIITVTQDYVQGKGYWKNSPLASNKMKESELRAKIKEMIVSEMALDIDTMENAPESEVDFLAELEGMLGEDDLYEAKEDEEEEIEVTDEFSTEEPQGKGKIDVTQNADADLTGDKKSVQDNLEAALEAAKALGDDKLVTQIGNSLTFFTKQHVVK